MRWVNIPVAVFSLLAIGGCSLFLRGSSLGYQHEKKLSFRPFGLLINSRLGSPILRYAWEKGLDFTLTTMATFNQLAE